MSEQTSFIEQVNLVAKNIEAIKEAGELFDKEIIDSLEELSQEDVGKIIQDLKRMTHLGNRKTDIDVALNKTGIADALSYDEAIAIWNDTTNTVYYDQATCVFVDGTVISVDFVNDDAQAIQVSTHGAIVDQLNKHTAFTTKLENTSITEDVGGKTGSIIRIVDVTGTSSNLERISLRATSGDFVDASPTYYWALTTSSLQTLANRVGDIIALGNDIDNIIVLSSRIDELLELQTNITQLGELHTELTNLVEVHSNLAEVLQADDNASIATEQAGIATAKAEEIKSITAEAITGASSASAGAVYNPDTGKFTFVIPQGLKGDKGEAFAVHSEGLLADRSLYDAQQKGFSFLAIDESKIYFKLSDTSADWSLGSPFGKGEKGDTGDDGNGIVGIQKTGSTANIDHYEITLTDGSTYAYNVTNASIDDTNKSTSTTYSSEKIESLTGDFSHAANKGDVVVTSNTNMGLINPVTFNSLIVEDGATLKLI